LAGGTRAGNSPVAGLAADRSRREAPLDTRKTLRYVAFNLVFLRSQEERVRGIGISIKRLFKLAVFSCLIVFVPLSAQELRGNQNQAQVSQQANRSSEADELDVKSDFHDFHINLMSGGAQSYISPRSRPDSTTFEKQLRTSYPGTIQRMESAFYCNDTPFVDQVRLPLAAFWRGRVKLIGFESDVTTANFVMGLPGQGALHNLSSFGGNGFLAIHTPPSDQLAGINMTISLHGSEVEAGDNSGLRGIEHLVHASRGFFPFLTGRSDSSSAALR
jgi:hypothetical protein